MKTQVPNFLRKHWLIVVGAILFAMFGLWLLRDSVGVPALLWGGIWREGDFDNFQDVADFYRHLRAGVPAFITLIELIAHVQFDGLDWLLTSVFRFFFVLTFMLPFLLFSRSVLHRSAVFLTCVVFLWSAAIITLYNQQVYDLYYPFFVLAFFVAVAAAAKLKNVWALGFACLSVGFFVAMIELARPFALLLIPILALHAGYVLCHLKKRFFLLMLLPVLLLSGGWHSKLFLLHDGQLFWSNNGGFNLYRNWKPEMDEEPVLLDYRLPENQLLMEEPFPGTGKLAKYSFNSEFHTRNSKILQAAVLEHIAEHPVSAAGHLLKSIAEIFRPHIFIFRMNGDEPFPEKFIEKYEPKQAVIHLYRPLVWLAAGLALANCFAMLAYLFTRRKLDFFRNRDNCLSLIIAVTTFSLALGEKGEEARFLVSLLPLLAVLPFGFRIVRSPSGGSRIELREAQEPARGL